MFGVPRSRGLNMQHLCRWYTRDREEGNGWHSRRAAGAKFCRFLNNPQLGAAGEEHNYPCFSCLVHGSETSCACWLARSDCMAGDVLRACTHMTA